MAKYYKKKRSTFRRSSYRKKSSFRRKSRPSRRK